MDDGVVADGDVVAHGERVTGVAVERGVILNAGVPAHRDGGAVAAEHRAVPDGAARADGHVADEHGVLRHKSLRVHAGGDAVEGNADHSVSCLLL